METRASQSKVQVQLRLVVVNGGDIGFLGLMGVGVVRGLTPSINGFSCFGGTAGEAFLEQVRQQFTPLVFARLLST
jgi:hypothetical protein